VNLSFHPVGIDQEVNLLNLWEESWSEVYPNIDFHARLPWFRDHMAAWVEGGGLRVGAFTPAHNLAGFILLNTINGHLDQICVRQDLKGAGVAGALMAEARRLSPHVLTLDVNAMNLRAIRFYTREGFKKTGEGINPRSGLPIFHYRWQP
jgi:putative acetyltransferase